MLTDGRENRYESLSLTFLKFYYVFSNFDWIVQQLVQVCITLNLWYITYIEKWLTINICTSSICTLICTRTNICMYPHWNTVCMFTAVLGIRIRLDPEFFIASSNSNPALERLKRFRNCFAPKTFKTRSKPFKKGPELAKIRSGSGQKQVRIRTKLVRIHSKKRSGSTIVMGHSKLLLLLLDYLKMSEIIGCNNYREILLSGNQKIIPPANWWNDRQVLYSNLSRVQIYIHC